MLNSLQKKPRIHHFNSTKQKRKWRLGFLSALGVAEARPINVINEKDLHGFSLCRAPFYLLSDLYA